MHLCPLCRIEVKIDFEYEYPFRYFWCDNCRKRVRQYWKPRMIKNLNI